MTINNVQPMLKDHMKVDTRFHEGKRDRPLVIFIHGMGMNVKAWSDPAEARILGGKYPLRVLLREFDVEMETSFADMKRLGFHVLSWSQSRTAGPIMVAVGELRGLIKEFEEYSKSGILFICHSRGGLIARKYLERNDERVKAVITLATPHHGTSIARWALYLSPLASAVNHLLDNFEKRDVDSAFRRILGFLGSSGLKELLPGSKFYLNLRDTKQKGIRYISLGGTNPDLLRAVSVSIPELMAKVIPDKIIPEEMREGYGDGLVSAASSVHPFGDEYLNFPVNHASILFDREVRNYITRSVESL